MLEAHILGRFDPDRAFEQLLKTGVSQQPLHRLLLPAWACMYDIITIATASSFIKPNPGHKPQTRMDGRALTGLRRLTMVRGMLQKTTAGSALVKIGGTKVVAGVTLQVGKPGEETPGKGEIGAFSVCMLMRVWVNECVPFVSCRGTDRCRLTD